MTFSSFIGEFLVCPNREDYRFLGPNLANGFSFSFFICCLVNPLPPRCIFSSLLKVKISKKVKFFVSWKSYTFIVFWGSWWVCYHCNIVFLAGRRLRIMTMFLGVVTMLPWFRAASFKVSIFIWLNLEGVVFIETLMLHLFFRDMGCFIWLAMVVQFVGLWVERNKITFRVERPNDESNLEEYDCREIPLCILFKKWDGGEEL